MMRFVALMIVAVTTYGVFRQTLRNPDEEWSWRLVRHIFFTPYFNIYGEIFPEEIDPPCYRNDSGQVDQVDGEMKECVTGQWLNTLMMAFYMLGAHILLGNLLISLINSIYAKTSIISRQIWKFNRNIAGEKNIICKYSNTVRVHEDLHNRRKYGHFANINRVNSAESSHTVGI